MTHVLSMEHLSASEAAELIGFEDRNLNCLCELYGADIVFRDNQFTIRCEHPEAVAETLQEMLKMIRRSQQISEQEIRYLVRTQRKQQAVDLGDLKIQGAGPNPGACQADRQNQPQSFGNGRLDDGSGQPGGSCQQPAGQLNQERI